jgi:glycosyltransferase involved in cell wall biosynthesis
MTAHGSPVGLRNLEGLEDYDIVWPWARPEPQRPGTTAVLRVRDEAPSLPFVLPPLLRACDSVLLVDNGSTDGTPDVARETAAVAGYAETLAVASYPFPVARAGAEHLAQHELSVHSLAYFYNWCFSQVTTRYSWKWDGDMVLTTEGEVSIAALGWQVGNVDTIVRVPRHGLYLDDDRHGFLDLGLRNAEEWGFPVGPDFVYTKAFEWEIRTTPEQVRSIGLPHGLCVELKYLHGDEFAHWTDPESFATSGRNRRKRREWEVFNALKDGLVPAGVVELTAPDGVHLVDYVTRDWLPRAPRPLTVGEPARQAVPGAGAADGTHQQAGHAGGHQG